MKLAVAYTVFNGFELLEDSISQIEDIVDVVIICWQQTSNKGNSCERVGPYVGKLFTRKKVVVIRYDPDLKLDTKTNERRKHQLMMDFARALGCTHITLAACDHFYDARQFVRGKLIHEANDWDVSFTSMFTYYKHPEWQLTPMEDYYMPFIIAMRDNTRIEVVRNYPLLVDPSVKVNTCQKWGLFGPDEVVLHHYSMMREDIDSKFANAAASQRWTPAQINTFTSEYKNYDIEKNPGVTYFRGRKIKIVPNYFDL
jgi:hypothetical protein